MLADTLAQAKWNPLAQSLDTLAQAEQNSQAPWLSGDLGFTGDARDRGFTDDWGFLAGHNALSSDSRRRVQKPLHRTCSS